MPNIRLPMAVCAAATEVLSGSHSALEALFEAAGIPGPPPDLAHDGKWKTWLSKAGRNPEVDSLAVLGNLIEEFMDLPPVPVVDQSGFDQIDDGNGELDHYNRQRERLNTVLEEHGFRYYRGGRVLPNSAAPPNTEDSYIAMDPSATIGMPESVEELLEKLIRGLPRAMHPLEHRQRGAEALSFDSEYDIQDLLHSQLRPWVADIRPEEYTPSCAGSSTRMDFLLPAHHLVLELKRIRDQAHGRKVGEELILDIEHYRRHPECRYLWCVI